MVYVNANLDQKTKYIVRTGRLNGTLADLSDAPLYITLVARDTPFVNEAWQEDGETFMQLVLPYEDVLISKNIDGLIYQQLYEQLDLLNWLDVDTMKKRLHNKIALMN